jgi:hypothetical protein
VSPLALTEFLVWRGHSPKSKEGFKVKYVLIIDGQAQLFETLIEVVEFLNFHGPDNYVCFEVAKEVKFARYYREVVE